MLDVTVPLHSAHAFVFTTYCDEAGSESPYSARLDGPGVMDDLRDGMVIARDLNAGPYRFTVNTETDAAGCS